MNDTEREGEKHLSLKITIIVFWGLAVIGVVFAIMLLGNIRETITEQRTMMANNLAYQLHVRLNHSDEEINQQEANNYLNKVIAEYEDIVEYEDIAVDLYKEGVLLVSVGNLADTADAQRWEYDVNLGFVRDLEQDLKIKVYFPDLEESIHARRSEMVIVLGLILLISGMLLKWVLDRILTRPLQAMVVTAKRISQGDTDLSFDTSTKDEFAYVSGFINEALSNSQVSEEDLQYAKDLAVITLHSIAEGVVTVDQDARVIDINTMALDLMMCSKEESLGKRIDALLPVINKKTRKKVMHPVLECLSHNKTVELEVGSIVTLGGGVEVMATMSVAPVPDPLGFVYGAVMVLHDISESLALQNELSFYASHDSLTGLYNRREFDNDLKRALEIAKRDDVQHVLCYMDLDQFKVVNDTCGHSAGDQLLKNLTAHLLSRLRKADVLARLGGDEFGLLLMYCSMEQAEEVADGLRQAVNDFQFLWEGKKFQVGVSIGLAPVSTLFETVADVLSAADMACYKAKEDGRDRIYVYRPDDAALHQRREEMGLLSFMRRASEEDGFELFLQAIHATSDRSVQHYEVLIRLRDEAGNHVLPGTFLPAAERYQLMMMIDRWVVSNTIKLLQNHFENGSDISVAINLSGQSIDNKGFLDFVLDQLSVIGDQAHKICFEITESTAINHIDSALFFINRIKEKGCSFALDDFGSGMSSFAYLKNFPVDYLKIDGSFVREMDQSKIDQAMVRAINEVAKVMGMKTIAEFVENEATYHCLQEIGVDYAQGYWLGKPFPAKEIKIVN
ncbi:MAG: EAL domain-containing protein [Gammaproteobacteria bacterium]|nr:EAL domain-containing protein [Gammaproteobacteria bacterium]